VTGTDPLANDGAADQSRPSHEFATGEMGPSRFQRKDPGAPPVPEMVTASEMDANAVVTASEVCVVIVGVVGAGHR